MVKRIHRISVVVAEVEERSPGIKSLRLTDEENWELPGFTAGAHLDVHLPSDAIRQYSLLGDPAENTSYRIAVKLESNGRGGSCEVHERIDAGQPLLVSLPRNTFPFLPSVPSVFIAGGIGITPFLSALPQFQAGDVPYHLHYCRKDNEAIAFQSELIVSQQLGRVSEYDNGKRLDIAHLLSTLSADTHVYCCGPAPMIDACEAHRATLQERLHVEYFGAPAANKTAYEIELASSGQIITVAQGQSMLQALRLAGIEMPASCEAGICLECKCRWLEGQPDHRELTLPKDQRSEWITPCVSSSLGGRILLDL